MPDGSQTVANADDVNVFYNDNEENTEEKENIKGEMEKLKGQKKTLDKEVESQQLEVEIFENLIHRGLS